jgi:predicted TIM-barrel fold metal-dependent hydrolase
MSVVFDAHSHCFPPLSEDTGGTARRLAEHQYHVRFHNQGIRRTRDNARVDEPLMAGERDGVTWQPDVGFRIGRHGRLEFTHGGEEYYLQWMPPTMEDMASSAEYIVRQMDYVGVDRAVMQHDRVYGRLDDFMADCIQRYPDRLVALAQVEEWRAGEPDQLERLEHAVKDLGHSGLYFSTSGFFFKDFQISVNDPELEPLWRLVESLGIPVHWYAGTLQRPLAKVYLEELREFDRWAEAHPGVACVLTHGLNNIHYDVGKPDRFTAPPEIIALLKRPGWHMELMLHLMNADAEFPPHSAGCREVVRILTEEVGADRLMWGSDMPCCERTVTYKQSMLLFHTQCDFLSDDERAAIMGDNLARLYPAD